MKIEYCNLISIIIILILAYLFINQVSYEYYNNDIVGVGSSKYPNKNGKRIRDCGNSNPYVTKDMIIRGIPIAGTVWASKYFSGLGWIL